jgi:hypothetical protein
MLSEESVPLTERYLVIEGYVSDNVRANVASGLPDQAPENTVLVFVSFAYADLPIGKRFDYLYPHGHVQRAALAPSRIIAVTQQFGRPFDQLPHGWKTICLIEFPHGRPHLIEQLPTVDEWFESDRAACLCSEATYRALINTAS